MKFLYTGLTGVMFFVTALLLRHFLPAYSEYMNWAAALGLILLIVAILWFGCDLYVNPGRKHPAPLIGSIPRGDDLVSRAEKLESACRKLEEVTLTLKSRISEMQGVVDASGVRAENESLQDLLAKEKADRTSSDQLAKEAREAAKTSQERADKLSAQLADALGQRDSKADEIIALKADLKGVQDRLDAITKAESDRLGQIVPVGLMQSAVEERVRWCFEHASKGDRLAAQILAALQSVRAAQDDEQLKGLLLSSLQVLGQSLSRLLEREQFTPEQKCDQFNEWSAALNDISASRFTITVPSIGARINLTTMISSGSDEGGVANVHCWGIRNEKGDLAYLAEIS
jgi:hypothetical protein